MEDESAEITRIIGSFGPWQLRIVLILYLPGFYHSFHYLATTFFSPDVAHWCKPPEGLYSNWSVSEWKQYSIPGYGNVSTTLSSCEMYERNYSILPQAVNGNDGTNLTVTKCMYGWDYDTSLFTHSLDNEFDLVCEREALAKTGASTFYAGVMIGLLVSGHLSDTFGRKITMMGCLLVSIVCGIITAFMPSLELFFVARFVLAMSLTGWGTTAYVLKMEFLDKKWKSAMGAYTALSWVVGYVSLPGYAYLVPNWRYLQLLITLQMIPFVAFWWFVPESVRWLMSKGKVEEAEEIAREGARVNKRQVEVDLKAIYSQNKSKRAKGNLLDLFRYRKMRRKTLILYYNWLVNAFVYYGLSLGAGDLGGNLFLTFILSGLVEIPAYIICGLVIMYFGRRVPYCTFMLVGGVACIATSAFDKGSYPYDWPIVSLAMVGKLCISATFMILYVYAIELYPTPVRNVGVASSSTCARIGSIIAPYVYLLRHLHPAVPLIAFGASSISAGFLILLLPETTNRPLPQTFQEVEMM